MDANDDQNIDLEELQLRGEYEEGVDFSSDYLEDEAVSVQRLCVSRLSDRFVSGSMHIAYVTEDRKITQEKKFNMSKLVDWVTPDPDVLIKELSAGRVRCRLQARMGQGKSTRLPFAIANRLSMRVLHVTLSAHCLQHTNNYNNARGVGHYCKRWSKTKRSLVCCMTYADFNSYMIGTDRDSLFKSFDTLFFDEGFVESVDVRVCKAFLAVYASADVNIIMASATISQDIADGDGGAKALGQFRSADRSQSVDDVVRNPKLIDDWIIDRTGIFCPDNESINLVRQTCEREGLDVRILDDASSTSDETAVCDWLTGDGSTLRVLVLHSRYGIGHNIPMAYALCFAQEQKIRFSGNHVERYLVPMDDKMVVQMKSRTGRGLADGSGGIIFTNEREVQSLSDAEKVEAFVWLSAGSVAPSKTGYWSCAYELFPDGLAATVAAVMLKSCIHPQIVARYLAQDGLIAGRYARAMNVFAQPDHFFRPSRYDLPTSHDIWSDQAIIGAPSRNIKVPYLATGELCVILQAISAISNDDIRVERWRPVNEFVMHDGYDSDDGVKKPTAPEFRLRRIEDKPLPVLPKAPVAQVPWTYKRGEIADVRHGGEIDRNRLLESFDNWRRLGYDNGVGPADVEVIQDSVVSVVESNTFGAVESPGGTTIMKLPIEMCRRINEGQSLSADMFIQLIDKVRSDGMKFASSKMFDCYSRPWDSFFNSLLDDSVVSAVARNGYSTDVYAIADFLRARFALEISAVVTSSNVFKHAYTSMFRKTPNMNKLMDAIRAGRFDGIAQSQGFIDRVKSLKTLIDRSLLFAENHGIYLPRHITAAQRSLPLRGENVLGYTGDNLRAMPSSWSDVISNHSRSSSSLSFRTK